MNFWPEFIKLKTAVGGNREVSRYEESFGLPLEEQLRITPTKPHNKRILSQLEFAIRLSEENQGAFDDCIGAALSYLTGCMEQDGVLTRSACLQAENLLLPCRDAAKEYKLILAGHAHIDMDWMWSYQETVALTLSTFRTVLNLMNQYPEFCFSQSQVLQVHDLVDFVSEEAELAGKFACQYVLGSKAEKDYVQIVNGKNVSYVCPQKVDKNLKDNVKLFFRVTNTFKDCTITAKCGDKVLIQKKKKIAVPGEMETLMLISSKLQDADGTIEVLLEEGV